MEFKNLTKQQQDAWGNRMEELGLNPKAKKFSFGRQRIVRGLSELKKFINAPVLKQQKNLKLTGESVKSLSDPALIDVVISYINGTTAITDQGAINEIDTRFEEYLMDVYALPDITVTAEKPLIISDSFSVTNYGIVTMKSGGYIKIMVPCQFSCQVLMKESGEVSSDGKYDVYVTGKDGVAGIAGDSGIAGNNGGSGANAQCNCSTADQKAGNGGNGSPGNDGKSGENGKDGSDAQFAGITIKDLQSNISVLNQGGNGGSGGNGGNGGSGGNGGKGGKDDKCNGSFEPAGNGGNGANGGNGGNGGNGANGGDGAHVIINFSSTNESKVVAVNGNASGGFSCESGTGGKAGTAGESGGKGGSSGLPGNKGNNGENGRKGNEGSKGTTDINPPSV